jgi:hypothetical protein
VEPANGVVGLRADDTAVDPAADGSALAFEFAERVGAQRLWHLRAGGEAVIVRAPDAVEPPAPGAALRVTVPREAVRRFDPDTGEALA